MNSPYLVSGFRIYKTVKNRRSCSSALVLASTAICWSTRGTKILTALLCSGWNSTLGHHILPSRASLLELKGWQVGKLVFSDSWRALTHTVGPNLQHYSLYSCVFFFSSNHNRNVLVPYGLHNAFTIIHFVSTTVRPLFMNQKRCLEVFWLI